MHAQQTRTPYGFNGSLKERQIVLLSVIATGQLHSVREMVKTAFNVVNLDWEKYVTQDARFFRPVEPYSLVGNPEKAKIKLGWCPKINFEQMIQDMVNNELNHLSHTLK